MIYIAAGWFTPSQEKALEEIESALVGLEVFSPRVDTDPVKGWDNVFNQNIENLTKCKLVLASTVDKDMGTLFECGVAYANNIPIVYYTPGLKGKFNLMLAKSARRVCTTYEELIEAVDDVFLEKKYIGDIE